MTAQEQNSDPLSDSMDDHAVAKNRQVGHAAATEDVADFHHYEFAMLACDIICRQADWYHSLGTDVADKAADVLHHACVVENFSGPAQVSVLLTDDAAMRRLNAKWRGRDNPTNVLAFPAENNRAGTNHDNDRTDGNHHHIAPRDMMDEEKCAVHLSEKNALGEAPMLGDIVLARETLLREARLADIPVFDHFRHLLVHGFLHLLGYDHVDEKQACRMQALEIKILHPLGIASPYATDKGEVSS